MRLVLTWIDFEKKDEVYKQARKGLSKYLRNGRQAEAIPAIKLGAFTAMQLEQIKGVFMSRGWGRPGRGARGGGPSRGAGRGRGGGGSTAVNKPENPKDAQGNIMRCPSCQSIRHLLDVCPDNYENLK